MNFTSSFYSGTTELVNITGMFLAWLTKSKLSGLLEKLQAKLGLQFIPKNVNPLRFETMATSIDIWEDPVLIYFLILMISIGWTSFILVDTLSGQTLS